MSSHSIVWKQWPKFSLFSLFFSLTENWHFKGSVYLKMFIISIFIFTFVHFSIRCCCCCPSFPSRLFLMGKWTRKYLVSLLSLLTHQLRLSDQFLIKINVNVFFFFFFASFYIPIYSFSFHMERGKKKMMIIIRTEIEALNCNEYSLWLERSYFHHH